MAHVAYSCARTEALHYVAQHLRKRRAQLAALAFVDVMQLFICGHLALERYQYINRTRANLMLAKLLANYPLHPVAIHRELEYPFWYGDRDATLAKRILANFQAQLHPAKSRAAIKQRNNLMFDQTVLVAEAITVRHANVALWIQSWRRHRRGHAGEVLQNPAETRRQYARGLWRGGR